MSRISVIRSGAKGLYAAFPAFFRAVLASAGAAELPLLSRLADRLVLSAVCFALVFFDLTSLTPSFARIIAGL